MKIIKVKILLLNEYNNSLCSQRNHRPKYFLSKNIDLAKKHENVCIKYNKIKFPNCLYLFNIHK